MTESINYLILNYLIVEGYENAALKFSKELGIDLGAPHTKRGSIRAADTGLSLQSSIDNLFKQSVTTDNFTERLLFGIDTMHVRNEIRARIHDGSIEEAIELINDNFPTLFEKNQFIYFKLLHLNLIEMIRNNDNKDEKQFLNDIITFIKDKLSTVKILQNEAFIKELELTMALLCFNEDTIPDRLTKLFDVRLRKEVGNLVNKSILINVNNKDIGDLQLIDEVGEDLAIRFNDIENVKLKSLMKLWMWSNKKNKQKSS